MGVGLLREVKACESPALRLPGHRLLLWVLAESARDETREAWPGFDELTRLTGAPRRTLRRWLDDLIDAGLISRVELGTGRDGRPVYAGPGNRVTYRIHPLGRDVAAGAVAATDGHHLVAADGHHVVATGDTGGGHPWHERRPLVAALPSVPSPSRQKSAARASAAPLKANRTDSVVAGLQALRDQPAHPAGATVARAEDASHHCDGGWLDVDTNTPCPRCRPGLARRMAEGRRTYRHREDRITVTQETVR